LSAEGVALLRRGGCSVVFRHDIFRLWAEHEIASLPDRRTSTSSRRLAIRNSWY